MYLDIIYPPLKEGELRYYGWVCDEMWLFEGQLVRRIYIR